MRAMVISMVRAHERRARMVEEFARLGLPFEFWNATDGQSLPPERLEQVDNTARRRAGLRVVSPAEAALWFSYSDLFRDMVENGPDLTAIFEDDARLSPELPAVLDALTETDIAFDVAILHRRNRERPYFARHQLVTGHALGRLKYADYGSEGVVFTRAGAAKYLERIPRMFRETDHSITYFWENGLDIFYLDPPVVSHDDSMESQIESQRRLSRKRNRTAFSTISRSWYRAIGRLRTRHERRRAWRELMRRDRDLVR